jgi:hypothetical protein
VLSDDGWRRIAREEVAMLALAGARHRSTAFIAGEGVASLAGVPDRHSGG